MVAVWIALLLGCGTPDAPDEPQVDLDQEQTDPATLLTRVSLDLRGYRPSPGELAAATSIPAVYEAAESYMQEDAFIERVKDWFAPSFRTRVEDYPFFYDAENWAEIMHAIAEEPNNLVGWIAKHDLPYTDLVQSDYTIVHPELLEWWPVDVITDPPWPAPEGTQVAAYNDYRPAAGVLSMNAMWWRHTSTLENANRGRANAITSGLLCDSFLDRAIDFPSDVNLSDSETIHEAIRENDACVGCHSSMDPVASYLWGFYTEEGNFDGWLNYAPAQERMWLTTTDRPPGWYGEPGRDLVDLGRQIGSDERFVMCGVKRVYTGLAGRRLTPQDDGALAEHRDSFLLGGLTIRSLVDSVIRDRRYQGFAEPTSYGGTPETMEMKLVTPRLLASDLEHLSGYRMSQNGLDAVSSDRLLRTIAGGSDLGAATEAGPGIVLSHRRLAEGAAGAFVLGNVDGGVLADELPPGALAESGPTDAQLDALLTHALSRDADPEQRTALAALWTDVFDESGSADQAWAALLTAVFADPQRLVY